MGCNYSATNRINNKIYIGWTGKTLDERKRSHEKSVQWGSMLAFHCALRKYGFDAFDWRILNENDYPTILKDFEKYYIRKMRTQAPYGYNLTAGGDGLDSESAKIILNSRDVCEKRERYWAQPEIKEARRQILLKVHGSPEARARNSATQKLIWGKPGMKEKQRKTAQECQNRPEVREKKRVRLLGKKQPPELVAKRVAARQGYTPSEKTRGLMREVNGTPEARIRSSQASKSYWDFKTVTPDDHVRYSEAVKLGWVKRKMNKLALMMLGA